MNNIFKKRNQGAFEIWKNCWTIKKYFFKSLWTAIEIERKRDAICDLHTSQHKIIRLERNAKEKIELYLFPSAKYFPPFSRFNQSYLKRQMPQQFCMLKNSTRGYVLKNNCNHFTLERTNERTNTVELLKQLVAS